MTIVETASRLGLSSELIRLAEIMQHNRPAAIQAMADNLFKSPKEACDQVRMVRQIEGRFAPGFFFGVALRQAGMALDEYRRRGLDESLWLETMGDIAIWCGNCEHRLGQPGLEKLDWLQYHFRLELFRLGRLQFQMTPLTPPDWVAPEALADGGLRAGQPVLNVHIPQGEPLDPEACGRSLAASGRFFGAYAPEYRDAPRVCESWLLYPGNRAILPPEGNIARFAGRFRILAETDDASQAVERIWSWPEKAMADLPEDTSLRRAAKAHLLAGGSLGEGFGLLMNNGR